MKHFARITANYASKNKAHDAAWNYLKGLDHVLLNNNNDREDFIGEIQKNIKRINQEHRRCTDMNVEIYSHNKERYLRVDIAGVVIIDIQKVFKEWESNSN